MKHLRVTPLRWLRRVPGKLYRNTYVRLIVVWFAMWEAVYWFIWYQTGQRGDNMTTISFAGLIGTFLVLLLMNGIEIVLSKRFMKQGVEHHNKATRHYALGTLALIHSHHGTYEALPAPDGKSAVRCACGQYIGLGTFPLGADRRLIDDWEKHLTEQVSKVMDNLEGELDARNARRSASI